MISIARVVTNVIHQPNGSVTVSLLASDGLLTYIGDRASNVSRPCIDGDVLSIQPNGDPEGRIAGTNGPYETGTPQANGNVLYQPMGGNGPAYSVLGAVTR